MGVLAAKPRQSRNQSSIGLRLVFCLAIPEYRRLNEIINALHITLTEEDLEL